MFDSTKRSALAGSFTVSRLVYFLQKLNDDIPFNFSRVSLM